MKQALYWLTSFCGRAAFTSTILSELAFGIQKRLNVSEERTQRCRTIQKRDEAFTLPAVRSCLHCTSETLIHLPEARQISLHAPPRPPETVHIIHPTENQKGILSLQGVYINHYNRVIF